MTASDLVLPLLGGALIGLASTLLLLFNGRVAGISGIVGGLLRPTAGETRWRAAFVTGLVLSGVAAVVVAPDAFAIEVHRPLYLVILAGLLVGFGTRLGNGCTSGHGVCGISRLSPRSLLATCTFIATGAVSVLVVEHLLGGFR